MGNTHGKKSILSIRVTGLESQFMIEENVQNGPDKFRKKILVHLWNNGYNVGH